MLPTISEYNQTIANKGSRAFKTLSTLYSIDFIPSQTFPVKLYVFGSGSFAVVFKAEQNRKYFAIRCFITVDKEKMDRCKMICDYLKNISAVWKVDSNFLDNEIDINGKLFPVIKMEWIDGEKINDFVSKNINNNNILCRLQEKLVAINNSLESNKIGHGDLQCDNLIIQSTSNDFEIKLIDYDSMFIPTLNGKKSIGLGTSDFQHPNRNTNDFNCTIDRFSFWVMLTALEALKFDKSLWKETMQGGFNTLDNFLFTANDFKNYNQSKIFNKLSQINSPELNFYIEKLKQFCTNKISEIDVPILYAQKNNNDINIANNINPSTTTTSLLSNQDFKDIFNKGIAKYKIGDYKSAIEHYNITLFLNPSFAEAYNFRGNAKLMLHDYQGAIADYTKAVEINPHFAEAYINKENAEKILNNHQGTIKDNNTPINSNSVLEKETKTKKQQKKKDKSYFLYAMVAIPILTIIILIIYFLILNNTIADTNKYNTNSSVNNTTIQNNTVANSNNNSNTANNNSPDSSTNNNIITDSSQNKNSTDSSANNNIIVDSTLLAISSTTQDYLNNGNKKMDVQDYNGAIADFTKAIALNPNDTEAYYFRGNAKNYIQDYYGAIEDFTKAIQLYPNNANSYFNRGIAKYNLQDYYGAFVDYTQAIGLNPNYTQAYNNRGHVKYVLQNYKGAIADFNKAIELDTNYSQAYFNRGLAKKKLGDIDGYNSDMQQYYRNLGGK